jgi:hypothetical protein
MNPTGPYIHCEEEETVQLHQVKFLSTQWGAPKVMEETVCDDVVVPSFFCIDTWKEQVKSIHG